MTYLCKACGKRQKGDFMICCQWCRSHYIILLLTDQIVVERNPETKKANR